MKDSEIIQNLHSVAENIFKKFDKREKFIEVFEKLSLENKYACLVYLSNCVKNDLERVDLRYLVDGILYGIFSSPLKADEFRENDTTAIEFLHNFAQFYQGK